MTNTRTNDAFNAAVSLITSSTSGWTWARAVHVVSVAFQLNADETNKVFSARS